jgi:SAM-dependent methyltransferase
MSPEVYAAFESICASELISEPILEVGAIQGPESLLQLTSLRSFNSKMGLNIEPFPSSDTITMVTGNANEMSQFADHTFGCVLCNATLEHDAKFWLSVAEMHRVLKPGGLLVIGVPGYKGMGPDYLTSQDSWKGKLIRAVARFLKSDELMAGTLTLGEHFFPNDYYRFSPQAVQEIFLEGFDSVQTMLVMMPPRIIGWGRKPT